MTILCIVAGLILVGQSASASISYGDFGPNPPGVVQYLGVTESSGTDPVPPGRYGAPTITGNTLDFDPTQFTATASSGSSDITDVQLNFTLMTTTPGATIIGLSLFESGDYTLVGTGTTATQLFAGAIMQITVLEVNGVVVAPMSLSPVNASVGFNLPSNSGVVQPWSLGIGIDIASQVSGATKVEVVINNSLIALSESQSIAFIAKKDFVLDADVSGVPEPATLALLGLGVLAIVGGRRKR